MTTDQGNAPTEGTNNQQPRERGGAAGEDRSKGLDTEQSGTPFGSPEKDAAEPKTEGASRKTP